MAAYVPDETDVRSRVDHGRARAKALPYGFPDEHLTADGVEVYVKLLERVERTGGLFTCYLCGETIEERQRWHLDHVTPLILRGPHSIDNLEAACAWCNLDKSDLTLETFLGPKMYADFMAGGGPVPFAAMRDRPTAELWARSTRVARRFARRPREVPFAEWEHWFSPGRWHDGLDVAIARVLTARPSAARPKAMALGDLAPRLGLQRVNSLNDNYWLRCMGMNDRPQKDFYHDNRLWPSPLIQPVQMGPRARVKGFKLRLGPPLSATANWQASVPEDMQPEFDGPRLYRDQDEFGV